MDFLVATSLLSSYKLDWGSLLLNAFGAGSAAATGDVSAVALTSCLGFSIHKKMKALVAAPFVAVLLPVPLLVRAKLRQQSKLWETDLGTAWRTTAIIALWLLHPAVMRESILVLLTRRIGDTTYAAADLGVRTDDTQYATTRTLALLTMVLYIVGYPLGLAYYMHSKRHQLRTEKVQQEDLNERDRAMLFYFYGSYKPQFYYWELIAFCTKVAFVLISAHASIESDPGVPLFWATVVALSAFVLEVKFNAYRRKVEGRLIKCTWFSLLALLLIAQGMVVGKKNAAFVLMLRVLASAIMVLTIFGFIATFVQQQYRKNKRTRSLSSQQDEGARMPQSASVAHVKQQHATAGKFANQNPMHAIGRGVGGAIVDAPKSMYSSSNSLTSEPEPEPESGVVMIGSAADHDEEQLQQEAQV